MIKKIENKVFVARRNQLLDQMNINSIAIVASADVVTRNADCDYPFRQNSDFYYLTGMNEPEAILILQKKKGGCKSLLFCRERNPEREVWDGARLGQEGAIKKLALDNAFPIDVVDEEMVNLLSGCEQIYCSFDISLSICEQALSWIHLLKQKVRKGVERPVSISDVDVLVHEMRLIKSDEEISILEEAANITTAGFIEAMKVAHPEMYEYELEAVLRNNNIKRGAHNMAYNPIVAGGPNACTLHYVENNCQIQAGELVLIDAGCELDCYASDITRTFPIDGQFSKEQAAIYNLVLKAQLTVIEMITPGVLWNKLNEKTVEVITAGLIELGLISSSLEEGIKNEAYKPFFMHGTGHWLGLDVHDVGAYKQKGQWRPLEAGMVFTVEPGIYINQDNTTVDAKWRGIGVRIEDDILVTETGYKVLTDNIPKTVEAIEQLMVK